MLQHREHLRRPEDLWEVCLDVVGVGGTRTAEWLGMAGPNSGSVAAASAIQPRAGPLRSLEREGLCTLRLSGSAADPFPSATQLPRLDSMSLGPERYCPTNSGEFSSRTNTRRLLA